MAYCIQLPFSIYKCEQTPCGKRETETVDKFYPNHTDGHEYANWERTDGML